MTKSAQQILEDLFYIYAPKTQTTTTPQPQQQTCCGTGGCSKAKVVKKTDSILVVIPAPGVKKSDLSVTVETGASADLLIVSATSSLKDAFGEIWYKATVNERVSVSKDLDLDKTVVEVSDGLIRIDLFRKQKPGPVKIRII